MTVVAKKRSAQINHLKFDAFATASFDMTEEFSIIYTDLEFKVFLGVAVAYLGHDLAADEVHLRCRQQAFLNIGAEEEKGNALVKETFPLLKECKDINFIGSVESRDIPSGYADVIVWDAFVGNCILKMFEGVGMTLVAELKESMLSSFRGKLGALLVKPSMKKVLKKYDASEYGGAPMIGLNGLVIKSHGSSDAKEIKNSIFQCIPFVEADITGKIRELIVK